MQAAFPLLALTACNWVYGLDSTNPPGPDAPYRCTDEAPSLRGVPVNVTTEGATGSYSISTDRRIAVALRAGTLYEGPGDAPLTSGAMIMPGPMLPPRSPRLAPEGDELFIQYTSAPTATVDRYTRQGNAWVHAAQVLSLTANSPDLSIPTARSAGPRHMMLLASISELREYVEMSPDQWMQVGNAYLPNELGSQSILYPNLTTDGLHLVFRGQDSIGGATLMYASRARLEDRFANAVRANPFFGNPPIDFPYLLEDCSRMYFVVSNPVGVHYVERN